MSEPIVIDKALVIEPGKTYVIECEEEFCHDTLAGLMANWKSVAPEGAACFLLPPGMRIAREKQVVAVADGDSP